MRNSVLHFALDVAVLVVALALEGLTPRIGGVGFPLLLAATAAIAARRSLVSAVFFALAAGGAEDASSSLPMMLSASYFLGTALWVRCPQIPRLTVLLLYPGYQLWLCVWTSGMGGGVFSRMLLSLFIGLVPMLLMTPLLGFVERKAGIDEIG